MSERSDDALRAHVRECDECRGAAVPIDALADVLGTNIVEVDAPRLSQLAVARVAPELHARAQQVVGPPQPQHCCFIVARNQREQWGLGNVGVPQKWSWTPT